MRKIYYIVSLLIWGFIGCREKYNPPLGSLSNSFLVVEGVLNAGQAATTIHLTRSFQLNQNTTIKTEDNAQLTVEGKDSTSSSLSGTGNGNYSSANLHLIPNNEYRLRIKTTDGKEYLSDYVTAKITPQIDSVGWDRTNLGVQIYVNTKDPSNGTRYYRWDYEETWEIHSRLPSDYIYDNGIVRLRQFPAEDVSVCWKYDSASNVILGSSIRLQQDIIYKAPVKLISSGEDRLSWRYSILVREYAMEEGAYNFFYLLKNVSENIGSLFSPQPSEIRGNIHCISNPSEFVIGYITASTIEEKRIFISATDVPQWGFTMFCITDTVISDPVTIKLKFGGSPPQLIPYDAGGSRIIYYLASSPECVDCTKRGGSIIRPAFW